MKKSITSFPVTVDYGTSVEDMVARGKYDWANDDIISKNFSTERTGKVELTVELVHFNCSISTDAALKELDKMGYRPAELHELLALGEKYPELQREFPIIALGSVWQYSRGNRFVAFLYRSGLKRLLRLLWIDYGWHGYCRFAIVRK